MKNLRMAQQVGLISVKIQQVIHKFGLDSHRSNILIGISIVGIDRH